MKSSGLPMGNESIQLLSDIDEIKSIVKNGTALSLDFEAANQSLLSICEVGITVSIHGEIERQVHKYFKPLIPKFGLWQRKNLKYKEKFLSDKPSILDFKEELFSIIADCDLVIAHHYETEISVFNEFQKNYDWPLVNTKPWACTYRLSKEYLMKLKSYSLENICKELSIQIEAHDALSDSMATMSVIYELIKERKKKSEIQLSLLDL